jgi:hypothetical protein
MENSLAMQTRQEILAESVGFQKSACRSPKHYASSSRSPERIVEKQRWKGNQILNANSFSNIRQQTNYNLRYDVNQETNNSGHYGEYISTAKHASNHASNQVSEVKESKVD